MAIAALVLGIASLCIMFVPIYFIAVLPAGAAIVLAVLGMKECDRDPAVHGRGMAVAGLVLGIIAAAVEIIGSLLWLTLFEAPDFWELLVP